MSRLRRRERPAAHALRPSWSFDSLAVMPEPIELHDFVLEQDGSLSSMGSSPFRRSAPTPERRSSPLPNPTAVNPQEQGRSAAQSP